MRRAAPTSLLFGLVALFASVMPMTQAGAAVRIAPGVRVAAVARGVGQPTNVTLDPVGGIWTTSGGNATGPSDGVWFTRRPGAKPVHVVDHLFTALGLAWFGGELYVSYVTPYDDNTRRHTGRVDAFSGFDGHRFHKRRVVLQGIPIGEHTVDSLAPGPDGRIYLGVGSETDAGPGRSGRVISFPPGGSGVRVEARGLRNPYGLAFIPGTPDLLVTENSRDDLGAFRPPDELNLVPTSGAAPFYGFPGCYDQGGPACRRSRAPMLRLPAHASSDGVAVTDRFGRYGLSAFIAQNGSSFPANPTGRDVVRVSLKRVAGGYRAALHFFASGFERFGPLGAVAGPDGSVYVTLLASGRVLRFSAGG